MKGLNRLHLLPFVHQTGVITAVGVLFGRSFASSFRTGLILAQGGEFAFVIFALAQSVSEPGTTDELPVFASMRNLHLKHRMVLSVSFSRLACWPRISGSCLCLW